MPAWPDDTDVWASEDFENLDLSLYNEMHLRFLVNNIIHILRVAGNHPAIDINNAAKQICIGTDFDGLINTIDCCKTITGLMQLKKDMRSDLAEGLTTLNIGADFINADELLDNIFYNNGKNFMLNRVRLMRG